MIPSWSARWKEFGVGCLRECGSRWSLSLLSAVERHSRTLAHHGCSSSTSSRSSAGTGRGSLDAEPSAGDTGILQSFMNAGHADRVEFLG